LRSYYPEIKYDIMELGYLVDIFCTTAAAEYVPKSGQLSSPLPNAQDESGIICLTLEK
jgi:hypothetical protein